MLKRSLLLPVTYGLGLILLAQCGKQDSSTAPAVSAAAAVESKAPANSIPVITEGLSPAFRAVMAKLDVGGSSLSYNEATGAAAWASILDGIIQAMPPSERKDFPPDFSFTKLFTILGLDSLSAVGTSSRTRADGSFHSRAVAYMPSGRQGLMTLTGGPAAKLQLLEIAPKNTDVGIELTLNLKDFTREALPKIMAFVPQQERAKAEAELAAAEPGRRAKLDSRTPRGPLP